ncbi:MAG: hypothetical protein V1897_07500 [Pseudomonadota bacterium]
MPFLLLPLPPIPALYQRWSSQKPGLKDFFCGIETVVLVGFVRGISDAGSERNLFSDNYTCA